jgi:hypothetical protein
MKNIEKIALSILAETLVKEDSVKLLQKQLLVTDEYAKIEKVIVNEPFTLNVQKTEKSLANGLPMMKTFKPVNDYTVAPAIYDIVSTTEGYTLTIYWQESEFVWLKAKGNDADKFINQ